MNLRQLTALLCLASFPATALFATQITNKINGVGYGTGKQDVYLCYNHNDSEYNYDAGNIYPNESFNLPTGKFSNFNARLGGCDYMDTYLGNFTVSSDHLNNVSIQDYSHEDVAEIADLTINNKAISGSTTYIPPEQTPLPIPSLSANNPWQFVGVNLSGNEFGQFWSPINSPSPDEITPFINAGMNTLRLPIRWAYLQPQGPGVGELDANYLAFIENTLENATQYNINVILDLHNYLRYSPAGVGYAGVPAGGSSPDGELVQDGAQMADVWSKLVTALQKNPKINQAYVIFDLSNEPTQLGAIGGTETALAYQNLIIDSIRKAGANNLVLIEGSHWTGLHSWSEPGDDKTAANNTVFTRETIIDPADNYAINVHQYFDIDFSGTHEDCEADLNRLNMPEFVNYLSQNQFKAIVTEFGTGRGNNCMAALDGFLNLMAENAYTDDKGYGFIGWTAWSAGHGWGGYPNYPLFIDQDAPQMDVFKKHL